MTYRISFAGKSFCENVTKMVLHSLVSFGRIVFWLFSGFHIFFPSKLNQITYLFPLCYDRETTDTYTIATAPSLGSVLRGPSFIYSSFSNRSRSNLDLDGKTPFLLGPEGATQSTWWEKGSIQGHLAGEMPIRYGCTFTQTVLNGMFLLFLLQTVAGILEHFV